MAKAADIGSKRLISLAPDAWLNWVTGLTGVKAREMLSSDFQWLNREGDVLQKAFHPDLGEFLALTEVQLRPDPRIPKRVRAYAALAEERYDLPVYPVVVNILPPSRKVDPSINSYSYEILGLQIRQDYQVINLWEIDTEIVLQQPLITLLPFVPILRGGGQESMLLIYLWRNCKIWEKLY